MGQLSYLVNKSNKLIKKNIELKNQITQLLLEQEKIITQNKKLKSIINDFEIQTKKNKDIHNDNLTSVLAENYIYEEEINNLKKHIYEIDQSNVSYQKQITQLENSLQNLNESYQNEISDYQQKIQELEDQLNSNKRKINRKQKSRITKDENSD